MATRTPKQTSKRSATAKPKPKPKPKPKAKRATAAKKKPPAKRRASGPDLDHVLATLPRALDAEGTEIGRAVVEEEFAADDARYVTFTFNEEMDSQLVRTYAVSAR